MSVLGKILAIFNAMVAGLLIFLLVLDYSARQNWSYAVHRYDLLIDGLPLDESEKNAGGQPLVDRLGNQTLSEVFAGTDGGPVKTQTAEVNRVRDELRRRIDSEEGGATREQKLAGVLWGFARTQGEREALYRRALPDNKANKFDDLDAEFTRPFDEVRNTGRSLEERKASAAHVLLGAAELLHQGPNAPVFNPETTSASAPATYKRLVAVVGVKAAAAELEAQAAALEKLAAQTRVVADEERAQFVAQHARLLYTLRNLAEELQAQQAFLQAKKGEAAMAEEQRNARRLQVTRLEQQRDAARKDTQDALARQAAREKEIYENLKVLRDAAAKNLELEKKIRELEGVK
jgi:hypothetical protein